MPARVSLQDMNQLKDPANTFDWAIWLPSVPGGSYTSRDFTLRATSSSIPAIEIETFKVEANGIVLQRPGRRIWTNTHDVTIFETRDGVARQLIEGWIDFQRNIRTNTGNYFAAYQVSAEIDLYDAPGNIFQRIQMQGFYPTQLGAATLDNASGLLTYQATFSFDRTVPLPLQT